MLVFPWGNEVKGFAFHHFIDVRLYFYLVNVFITLYLSLLLILRLLPPYFYESCYIYFFLFNFALEIFFFFYTYENYFFLVIISKLLRYIYIFNYNNFKLITSFTLNKIITSVVSYFSLLSPTLHQSTTLLFFKILMLTDLCPWRSLGLSPYL